MIDNKTEEEDVYEVMLDELVQEWRKVKISVKAKTALEAVCKAYKMDDAINHEIVKEYGALEVVKTELCVDSQDFVKKIQKDKKGKKKW